MDGVPDLRGKQRGKGAAVEVEPMSRATRALVSNPLTLALIHIPEPTRPLGSADAVFCLIEKKAHIALSVD